MPRSKFARLISVVLVFVLFAVACGDDDDTSTADPTTTDGDGAGDEAGEGEAPVEGEPVAGGDLVLARPVDVKQLDPLPAVETETIYTQLMMMETLLVTDPEGGTQPRLALSAEPQDDGVTWRVTLREDVTFSDGSEMTSADVKFSLDRARESDEGFAYLLGVFSDVVIVDDYVLDVVTAEPVSYVPALLALWTGAIIPADYGGLTREEFFEAPVGTGPFVFDSWSPGQSITLVRNDAYWQEGKPYLDSVTWTQVSDDSARVVQLEGEQAQIAGGLPFSSIAQLESSEGVTVQEFSSTLQYFVMFNLTKEPFDDPAVRRAIAMALDKESMVTASLFGRGEVACSILPPTMAFHSDEVPCLEFDLEAAKAELATSSVPDGFETSILIGGTDGQANTVAEIVVANLAELNIDVSIDRVDPAQLYETQTQADYEMIFQGWGSDIPDPDQQLTFMLDPEAGGAQSYWTFYDNPEIIEPLSEARVTFDEEERAALYATVQELHAADVPHVPLLFQPQLYAFADEVKGFEVLPTGNYFMQNVWLDE